MQDPSPFLANLGILKTIQAWPSIRGMDDLLETVLSHILDFLHVWQAEILLCNSHHDLILRDCAQGSSRERMRLLSGIANIMSNAIENINLYRQSLLEKRKTVFLIQSISEYKGNQDLKKNLKLFIEKHTEFINDPYLIHLSLFCNEALLFQQIFGDRLGLSLTHRILEAYKGQIWFCHNPSRHLTNGIRQKIAGLEQPPGKGIAFHVLLPIKVHLARRARNVSPQTVSSEIHEDNRGEDHPR